MPARFTTVRNRSDAIRDRLAGFGAVAPRAGPTKLAGTADLLERAPMKAMTAVVMEMHLPHAANNFGVFLNTCHHLKIGSRVIALSLGEGFGRVTA